jgi:hypothetical protein
MLAREGVRALHELAHIVEIRAYELSLFCEYE